MRRDLDTRLLQGRSGTGKHPIGHIASQRVAAHVGLQPSGELTHEGEELWVARYE